MIHELARRSRLRHDVKQMLLRVRSEGGVGPRDVRKKIPCSSRKCADKSVEVQRRKTALDLAKWLCVLAWVCEWSVRPTLCGEFKRENGRELKWRVTLYVRFAANARGGLGVLIPRRKQSISLHKAPTGVTTNDKLLQIRTVGFPCFSQRLPWPGSVRVQFPLLSQGLCDAIATASSARWRTRTKIHSVLFTLPCLVRS